MKWYEDIRDELAILALAVIAGGALLLESFEIAAICATALANSLKKDKKNNGNPIDPRQSPPRELGPE